VEAVALRPAWRPAPPQRDAQLRKLAGRAGAWVGAWVEESIPLWLREAWRIPEAGPRTRGVLGREHTKTESTRGALDLKRPEIAGLAHLATFPPEQRPTCSQH
jgi:hypothetical protein